MKTIPLMNPFGDRIGQIEIEDIFTEVILDTMPRLELGYLVRYDEIEKFVLKLDGPPHE